MHRASIAVIAAALMVASTQIAAAAAPSVYDWSGLYVGANAGGAWSGTDWKFYNGSNTESLSQNSSSWIAGGQVGGLFHLSPHWVAGVEGAWSATGISDNSPSVVVADRTRTSKVTDLLLATGRLGYSSGKWLSYIKGGYANANVGFDSYVTNTGLRTTTSTGRDGGWVAGGGLEYGLTRCISVGLEYDYVRIDIANRNQHVSVGYLTPETVSDAHSDGSTVWARVNLRLDSLFGG